MSTSAVDRFVADGIVTGGMIPKLRAAAEAANAMRDGGVVILDGRAAETILAELLGKGGGTLIRRPGPATRAPR
jgi:acetylglutamate kinase